MNEAFISRVTALLAHVAYPSYTFFVARGHGGVYLRAFYVDRCVETGIEETQYTRKWLLSPHMTDSEIVQTAFKCALTSAEHRAREYFTYKGKRVFGPHFDIEDLVKISENAVCVEIEHSHSFDKKEKAAALEFIRRRLGATFADFTLRRWLRREGHIGYDAHVPDDVMRRYRIAWLTSMINELKGRPYETHFVPPPFDAKPWWAA